jgi:putative endonuclease
MPSLKNNLLNRISIKLKLKSRQRESYRPSKEDNLKTGRFGEEAAKRHLIRKGFKIIEENYRTKFAEIDLIAHHKDILVFVEVRTKVGSQFGSPEESLNRRKINKVARNAQMYMKYKRYSGKYRIDSVCVVLSEKRRVLRLNHYENITL